MSLTLGSRYLVSFLSVAAPFHEIVCTFFQAHGQRGYWGLIIPSIKAML